MSAWNEPINDKNGSNFRWAKWYVWSEGYNTSRFVGEPVIVPTHYIQGKAVLCLGKDCPVCADNRRLWEEYGKDAKDRGYLRIDTRIFANVFDRTSGKICPKCGRESKNGETVCATKDCGQLLTSVEEKPLNVIRVMNLSKTTFEELQTKVFSSAQALTNKSIEPTEYDITFLSVGSGKERRSKPQSVKVLNTDTIQFNPEDVYDIHNSGCYVKLTANEMKDAMKGISFKDIFSARKVNNAASVETVDPEQADPEQLASLEESIQKMFD